MYSRSAAGKGRVRKARVCRLPLPRAPCLTRCERLNILRVRGKLFQYFLVTSSPQGSFSSFGRDAPHPQSGRSARMGRDQVRASRVTRHGASRALLRPLCRDRHPVALRRRPSGPLANPALDAGGKRAALLKLFRRCLRTPRCPRSQGPTHPGAQYPVTQYPITQHPNSSTFPDGRKTIHERRPCHV